MEYVLVTRVKTSTPMMRSSSAAAANHASQDRLLPHLRAAAGRYALRTTHDSATDFAVPMENDLIALRSVLQIFGLASGLFANLDKSVATPMHCTDADIERIQEILSCRIEGFPSRYLGIPLSIFRLKRGGDEQAIIDAVAARIPQWKGDMLTSRAE